MKNMSKSSIKTSGDLSPANKNMFW